MNCNLVTKLKMQCFNSLFHCRAADLFNQHSKYVCSSFHARRRSSSWELIFYCLSTYCCLDMRKNHLFCHCYQTKQKQKEHQCMSGVTQLPRRCCGEELGTMAGCPQHPAAHWAALGRIHPKAWALPIVRTWSCGSKDFFPKDTWAEGVLSPWGAAGADSSPRPCPWVGQLFKAG